MAWPRFDSEKSGTKGAKRWQHRLKRERPTCTERNESLLESADGSMATAATRQENKKPCSMKPVKNPLDSDRPSHGRPFHAKSGAERCSRSPPIPPTLPLPKLFILIGDAVRVGSAQRSLEPAKAWRWVSGGAQRSSVILSRRLFQIVIIQDLKSVFLPLESRPVASASCGPQREGRQYSDHQCAAGHAPREEIL